MSSFGHEGGTDRLAALRTRSDPENDRRPPRSRRPELMVAAGAVAVGVILLLLVALPGRNQVQVADQTTTTVAQTNNSRIPVGMALLAFPVAQGHLPPALRPGDRARIVATPAPDGTGTTRVLAPVVTVERIEAAPSLDGSTVVSVIADESIAASIAGSGPVHVFLTGERR